MIKIEDVYLHSHKEELVITRKKTFWVSEQTEYRYTPREDFKIYESFENKSKHSWDRSKSLFIQIEGRFFKVVYNIPTTHSSVMNPTFNTNTFREGWKEYWVRDCHSLHICDDCTEYPSEELLLEELERVKSILEFEKFVDSATEISIIINKLRIPNKGNFIFEFDALKTSSGKGCQILLKDPEFPDSDNHPIPLLKTVMRHSRVAYVSIEYTHVGPWCKDLHNIYLELIEKEKVFDAEAKRAVEEEMTAKNKEVQEILDNYKPLTKKV